MEWWQSFWAWANENGGGLTAVATSALVLATLATLSVAGRDSYRRSRPMVSASFVFGPNSPSTILLRIKNYGPTRARNVDVRFEPPIPSDKSTDLIRTRYSARIGVVNPGETYDNSWFIPDFSKGNESTTNVYMYPDKIRVVVTYTRFWWFRFKDVTDLNVATHLNTSDTVASTSMLGSARRVAGAIESIVKKLP